MKNITIAIMKNLETYAEAELLKATIEENLRNVEGLTFQYSYNDDLN